MTSKERLRRAYFHGEMDRPGVFLRTGYPEDDPTYEPLRAYMESHSDLKVGWEGGSLACDGLVEVRQHPCSEDWDRQVCTMHTPAGDLQATRLISRKGLPGLEETHYLKTRADAEKYLSLPLPELSCDVSGFHQAVAAIGSRGIVDVSLGRSPGGHIAELWGSENFAIQSVEDREVLHELCRHEMRRIEHIIKHVVPLGVGPFFSLAGEEFLVPPLHGPGDFTDFIVQYEKPLFDLVHEAGGRVHVHSHGSIKKVLGGFLEMGVDVLHPFEAPPMGDITAAEAKQMVRGRMTIEGNIQIADMYESTPDDIRAQTEALIHDAFEDRRGLIVCPTASTYQRGKGEECFENVKAMVETVLSYG